MSGFSIPTTSALPSTQLIPSTHPAVTKTLGRLSRPSLLSLVLDWLDERNQEITAPYLVPDDDEEYDAQDLYPPAASLDALRETYTELQAGKGSKRDVLDRVIEGDWRDGINLYQLAMADMQYLYDHPASQKWTALKVARLTSEDEPPNLKAKSIPRFHPATFLRNLQKEILPDVKAHYNLDRHSSLPLLILRVFIIESPYNTSLALATQKQTNFETSRTFYIAFPDDSPFVYVSLTTSLAPPGVSTSRSDTKSVRTLILEGIPKAFSRPRERFKLEPTNMSARNLEVLIDRKGGGRTNAAGGGWSIYTDEKKDGFNNPLNTQLPTPDPSFSEDDDVDELNKENIARGMKRRTQEDRGIVKRRKTIAQGRFGNAAKVDDKKGIERVDVRMADPFPIFNFANTAEDYPADDELGNNGPVKRKGRRSSITMILDQEIGNEDNGDEFRPDIRVTFQGSHVFAGVRGLVEAGVVDGERMPGWMTGEDGVSCGVVHDGRIRGNRGSGL
jgi:central kinetochore subunit Mis15/CHL4